MSSPHAARASTGAWWIALATTLFLSACTHTPPQPSAEQPTVIALPPPGLSSGHWDGRLSLKLGSLGSVSASGVTLAFDLDIQATQGVLNLSTAMGTQVARLSWHTGASGPEAAILDTAEGRQTFTTIDAMTQQVLGEALPLSAITWWLRGLPEPMVASQTGAHPQQFTQHGWQVDATGLQEGRLEASRPASASQRSVTLRLRLDL